MYKTHRRQVHHMLIVWAIIYKKKLVQQSVHITAQYTTKHAKALGK